MSDNNRGWTKGPDSNELYVEAMEAKAQSELASATLLDIPKAKCGKCGSENLKDTGSFMVEIHQCQDCGELYCEDSGGVAWDV